MADVQSDNTRSGLFRFLKDTLEVHVGQRVDSGDMLDRIGFSGAATVYTHLHYQLVDGPDFLSANPLPARFRRAVFVQGDQLTELTDTPLDTADTIWNP